MMHRAAPSWLHLLTFFFLCLWRPPAANAQPLSEAEFQHLDACQEAEDYDCIAALLNDKADHFFKRDSAEDGIVCIMYRGYYAELLGKLPAYHATILALDSLLDRHRAALGDWYADAKYYNRKTLGNYYHRLGAFEEARLVFEELLAELKQLPEPYWDEFAAVYMFLGDIHEQMGNYQVALGLLEQSLESARRDTATTAGFYGLLYKQLGDVYYRSEQPDRARQSYRRALQLFDAPTSRGKRNRFITTCNALAELHLRLEELDSADYWLRRSLTYHTPDDPFKTETYRQLGEVYAQRGDYAEALAYLEQALSSPGAYEGKNYQTARIYRAMGDLARRQGQSGPALAHYQEALIHLAEDFDGGGGYCANPSLDRLYAWKDLLLTLYEKAALLYHLGGRERLRCAFDAARRAVDLIDRIRVEYISDYDKQFLMEDSYAVFEKTIEICYALQALFPEDRRYADYAFEVAEKSKALLLLTAFRNTQVYELDVPAPLLEQEKRLRYQVSSLVDTISALERRPHGAAIPRELSQARVELAQLQEAWTALVDTFQQQYPEYYNVKFRAQVRTAAAVREQLEPGQALVTYFVGEDSTWAFRLTAREALRLLPVPVPRDTLQRAVQEFTNAIVIPYMEDDTLFAPSLHRRYSKERAHRLYADRGHRLYAWLLGRLFPDATALPRELFLIPDGALNVLPFDALLLQSVPVAYQGYYGNDEYQYLARHTAVSYCYSATLLEEMTAPRLRAADQQSELLAFHVDQFNDQITSIQRIFRFFGVYPWFVRLLNEEAHQRSLETLGGLYRFLHFSVHGNIDHERPSRSHLQLRAFGQDSLLYLQELYRMQLPVDMVVTSACFAGIGKIRRGEGMLSLARGFSYSGARSLVTTLWKIDNGPTTQVLQGFYRHLKGGQPKNRALAAAKQDHLALADDEYSHPFYWAAFAPIGNMEKIQVYRFPLHWLLLGGGALLLLLLRRRRAAA